MHILEPLHIKLKPEETDKLLKNLNISLTQLPKIRIVDPALPKDCEVSDVIKIERVSHGKKINYFRVVSI